MQLHQAMVMPRIAAPFGGSDGQPCQLTPPACLVSTGGRDAQSLLSARVEARRGGSGPAEARSRTQLRPLYVRLPPG
jgi:hypothetical protein